MARVVDCSPSQRGRGFADAQQPLIAGARKRRSETRGAPAAVGPRNAGIAQREIAQRREVEARLRENEQTLENRIAERTAELADTNEQLRAEAAEREKVEIALRQAQKMEAIGQLTGGVAHDFNNLLTVIIGNLETLGRQVKQERPDPARLSRSADLAMRGARRAEALTQRLLAFSRQQPLVPKAIDLSRLVVSMSDLLRRTLGEQIEVETVLSGGVWRAFADPNQLEVAILNLAVNARDAMAQGGKLTIETANVYLDERYAADQTEVTPGQYAMIAISDTGTGMPPEVIARAFEPFFTTKDIGHGTGLGLSQVYGFVKQSGGHVRIYSEVGSGTSVKLYLPRLLSDAAADVEETTVASAGGIGSETILHHGNAARSRLPGARSRSWRGRPQGAARASGDRALVHRCRPARRHERPQIVGSGGRTTRRPESALYLRLHAQRHRA
jgi:signal transduction histidine kinase